MNEKTRAATGKCVLFVALLSLGHELKALPAVDSTVPIGSPNSASTTNVDPENAIRTRLEEYRNRDIENELLRRNRLRAAEETRKGQAAAFAEKKKQDYLRTWKQYGNLEINWLSWIKAKDGTWVATSRILGVEYISNFPETANSQSPYFGTKDCNYLTDLPLRCSTDYALLPIASIDKIWVKVRQPISVEELSNRLKLAEERLAKLNDVNEDHHFRQGDWVVFPSQQSRQIKQLAAIDTSELRRTPPLQSLPLVEDRAVVRFGDTVVKIAQRYGMTLQELLRLNPGLETARLVVGSQVRLAQASSGRTRMVLGLKPTTSGGISWPELPGLDELNNSKLVSKPQVILPDRRRIAVSCKVLKVNHALAKEPWGKWMRPDKESAMESLLVDFCSNEKGQK